MRQQICPHRLAPATKDAGLRELQQLGWVLVDATYEPVNALDDAGRDGVIVKDYPLLRDDLAALLSTDLFRWS